MSKKKKSTRNQQRIRQKKRERRSGRRRTGAGPAFSGQEAMASLGSLPELSAVRFPPEALLAELLELDAWMVQTVAVAERPNEILDELPGPMSLHASRDRTLERLASEDLARTAAAGLAQAARRLPRLREAAKELLVCVQAGGPPGHSPFWHMVLSWSLTGSELPQTLLERGNLWVNPEPRLPQDAVPTATICELLERAPTGSEEELRQAVREADLSPALHECYHLLRYQARIAALAPALTLEEEHLLRARLSVDWARRQLNSPLARTLVEAVPQAASELPLALAFLAGDLGPQEFFEAQQLEWFLADPDDADFALNLAKESDPPVARGLLEWVAAKYPDIFDAHLELAKLTLDEGRPDEAAAHARRCLEELAKQEPEAMDDEARRWVEQEVQKVLAAAAGDGERRIDWELATRDVPCDDAPGNLDSREALEEAVEGLVDRLEDGTYLGWEAAIRKEQGLPLTARHREALGDLVNFGDEEDRILSIDDRPRPSQPWYEEVRRLASALPVDPIDTARVDDDVTFEGWPQLREALLEHAVHLELPAGAGSVLEVIPDELRHRLEIQSCYEPLSGLGSDPEFTLEIPQQRDRIELFVETLAEAVESVRFFDLTLERLLAGLILPPRDREILGDELQRQLGVGWTDPLADRLEAVAVS